jgi:general secretion pathway protein A
VFLDYYQLSESPFGVTPDPRFLFLGPSHREALASLFYATEANRGFLALIAEPGMGKTSLLYHYFSYLRAKARTAFVFRTDCDSREFIRHILLDLGVDEPSLDLPGMHDKLNQILVKEMQAGRRFVLVIDEAQNLEEKVLESVRLLSNFETPWAKLMHIVIAGQPQLADRLSSPSMTQVRQRIAMVIRLRHLTEGEVHAYIRHRLWIAGSKVPTLFTQDAETLIAEYSQGIPRIINNVCFNSLSLAWALRQTIADREIVREVIADLDLRPLIFNAMRKNEAAENQKTPVTKMTPLKTIRSGARAAFRFATIFVLLLLSVASGNSQHSRPSNQHWWSNRAAAHSVDPFLQSFLTMPPKELSR